MLFVKAINNVIAAYPYTQTDLIRDNPSTSFPAGGISTADLAEWNVFPVHFSTPPAFDHLTERLTELAPLYDGSSWIQQWAVEPKSQEEIDAVNAQQAASVRDDRNRRLAESDWTQLPDSPPDALTWGVYRKALRDIPSQPGFPWDIIWPEAPQ